MVYNTDTFYFSIVVWFILEQKSREFIITCPSFSEMYLKTTEQLSDYAKFELKTGLWNNFLHL